MKHLEILLTAALVSLLAAIPAAAYIKAPPQTLGSVCLESDHITVLKVEKVDGEKGVIHFEHVEQLKGKQDAAAVKHLIKSDLGEGIDGTKGNAAKIILGGATEGKTAVMFYFTGGNSRGHVYIDGYWYWVVGTDKPGNWIAAGGEATQLAIYCGTATKLRDAVEKILKGEEVTVQTMAADNRTELFERRAKVQDVSASLKIVGADTLARIANRSDGKKPAGPKPAAREKPTGENKPSLVGTVKTVAANDKTFTLQTAPTEKNKEGSMIEIQIVERTTIAVGKEAGKLAVGQAVSVWLGKGDAKIATSIQIGKPVEKPVKPAVEAKAQPVNKGGK